MSSLQISDWLSVFLLSPHQLTRVTSFCMITLATTFIPIKRFLNLQLALSFRVKHLMVLLFPMTNDLIFSCVECITFNYLLSLVCLFRGRGGGGILWAPRYHCALRGLKWGWGGCLCVYMYVFYVILVISM